jgi:hypothetical protein
MRVKTAAALSMSLLALGNIARAQRLPDSSIVGARVKFGVVSQSGEALGLATDTCEGSVARVNGDIVLIVPSQTCIINTSVAQQIASLYVEAGNRGSRATHLLFGALIGAGAGGLIGRLAAGDGCRIPGCDDAGFAIGVLTMGGIAAGTIVGGVVGLALPAGSQWRALPHTRPVLIPSASAH